MGTCGRGPLTQVHLEMQSQLRSDPPLCASTFPFHPVSRWHVCNCKRIKDFNNNLEFESFYFYDWVQNFKEEQEVPIPKPSHRLGAVDTGWWPDRVPGQGCVVRFLSWIPPALGSSPILSRHSIQLEVGLLCFHLRGL